MDGLSKKWLEPGRLLWEIWQCKTCGVHTSGDTVIRKTTAKPSVIDGRSHDNKLFITVKVPDRLDTSDALVVHRKTFHN